MRKFIVAMMCLGMFVAVADAGSTLHLYFSTTGPGAGMPPEWAAQENPVLPAAGGTAYLWANVLAGDLWNGVSLENHGALATGGEMYNATFPGGYGQRWQSPPASDLDPADDQYIFGFAVQAPAFGLGHVLEGEGSYRVGQHYLIATYDFDGSAPVFLAPGFGGISLSGAGPGENDVYIGFGDGPIPDNAIGVETDVADLTFIPEPASMLLLGLAGLLLRRR